MFAIQLKIYELKCTWKFEWLMALEVLRDWPKKCWDSLQSVCPTDCVDYKSKQNFRGVVCPSMPAGGYSTATVYKHWTWTHSNHKEKNEREEEIDKEKDSEGF